MEYQECSYTSCGNPVFARGICQKHYEQERLKKADPCSITECTVKATKRGMCELHYQAWRKTQTPICKIENCTEHSRGKKYGLCQKHEYRLRRHATIEQPRAADWGAREAHPMYKSWTWHKRGVDKMCDEWRNDFWAFVDVVGDRPANHTLRKKDVHMPISPDNWYWKESYSNKDKAEYARHWRSANARRVKGHDLKRMYGITIDDYERMFKDQDGVCAICKEPEKSHQRDGSPSSLAVDHCHETKKIRGLLCHHCNRGIGLLRDSPDLLIRAAEYLAKSNRI